MNRPRTTLIQMYACTLALGLAFGCAKPEVLTGIPESLSITAWNGVTQNAAEYRGAVEIDLGTVGAGETSTAWFEVLNNGQRAIELHEVLYDMDRQRGERWEVLEWLPAGDWARRSQLTLPQTLAPGQSLVLGVPFTAASLGSAETEARLAAGQTIVQFVRVVAEAVPGGSPDISIGYGDAPGTTIETSCSQGVCSPPSGMPLVLGSFDADTPVTIPMHIRNMAHCAVLEGEDACSTCELRVESPLGARGITLSDGTMSDAGFTLETADEALVIPQQSETCETSGLYSFNLTAHSAVAGTFETVLTILSNAPDKGEINIPVQVRFNDVALPTPEPDIEVSAGTITGPNVGTECADGICVLNGGSPIALPTIAPGASSSMVVTMRNTASCPEELSCDACAIDITNVAMVAGDTTASWQVNAPFSSNTLHPERSDCTLPSSKEVSVLANTAMAGTFEATLTITSTDLDESQIAIPLMVAAEQAGEPEIEVEIEGMVGPIVGTDCYNGVCRLGSVNAPIYLGHILPGTSDTTQLYIRNRANCTGSCNSCGLTLTNGLRFANGGTSQSAFSVAASAGSSATILREDATCGEDGLFSSAINFTPSADGNYTATLVIESNDADEPRIEVFLAASSGPEPVAIASVDPCTTAVGYQASCNSDNTIDPMENVRLDGSASFDPSGLELSRYIWTVDLAPTGSQRTAGEVLDTCYAAWEDNCELYEGMLADLPGEYRVCLTVENSEGLESVQTSASCTTFSVLPPSQLHVQLTWPEVDNADQDLHLVHVENDPRVCNQQSDCHWRNCKPDSMNDAPIWFAGDAAGQGANPRLDVDSTSGSKHENINIDQPQAGTYSVYVHYYEWTDRYEGPSEVNVTIWLGGIEVFSSSKTLSSSNAIWRIGDITWGSNGGTFTPYDPYGIGMIGDVEFEPGLSAGSGASTYYCGSIQGGWEFPE